MLRKNNAYGNDTVLPQQPMPSYELFKPHIHAEHDFIVLKPHGKEPAHKNWPKRRYVDTAQSLMEQGFNLGIRLKDTDLVIDVDPRNFLKFGSKVSDSLALLCRHIRYDFELAPRIRTGSGGLHIYFRKPADLKIAGKHKYFPGIEFKSKGQQAVAGGSVHPVTKKHYYIEPDPFIDELWMAPEAPIALLDLIARNPKKAPPLEGGVHTAEQLESMLEGLDPDKFRTHSKWLELMMACHHATGGEGMEEFVYWSTRDFKYRYEGEKICPRWESLNSKGANKVTYKTLYGILHRSGKGHLIPPMLEAEDGFEPVDPEDLAPYL